MVVFSRWDLALNFINKYNTDHINTLSLSIHVVSQRTAFGKNLSCPRLSSEMVSAKCRTGRFEAEKCEGTDRPFSIDCFKAQSH